MRSRLKPYLPCANRPSGYARLLAHSVETSALGDKGEGTLTRFEVVHDCEPGGRPAIVRAFEELFTSLSESF